MFITATIFLNLQLVVVHRTKRSAVICSFCLGTDSYQLHKCINKIFSYATRMVSSIEQSFLDADYLRTGFGVNYESYRFAGQLKSASTTQKSQFNISTWFLSRVICRMRNKKMTRVQLLKFSSVFAENDYSCKRTTTALI